MCPSDFAAGLTPPRGAPNPCSVLKQPCSVEVDGSSYRLLVDDAERVQALASALNQRLAGLGAAPTPTPDAATALADAAARRGRATPGAAE